MAPGGAAQAMFFISRKTSSWKMRSKKTIKNNIVMDTVNVIDENKSQVILRIVPVKIRGKTTIETNVMKPRQPP
jgi:hypothetical protein